MKFISHKYLSAIYQESVMSMCVTLYTQEYLW